MNKYIECEAFIAEQRHIYCDNCDRRKGMKNGKMKFVYGIGDAPCKACDVGDMLDKIEDYPAADVVEVVRCWNCGHYNKPRLGFCETYLVRMHGDDFCSYGKKRGRKADV